MKTRSALVAVLGISLACAGPGNLLGGAQLGPPLPKDLAQLAAQLDAQMHVSGDVVGEALSEQPTSTSIRASLGPSDVDRQALARLTSTPDGWRCYVARGIYLAIGAYGRYLRVVEKRNHDAVELTLKPLYVELRRRAGNCWDGHGGGTGPGRGAMEASKVWSGKRQEAFEHLWTRESVVRWVTTAESCVPVPMPGITACAPMRDEVFRPTPGQALLIAAFFAACLAPPAAAAVTAEGAGASSVTWAEVLRWVSAAGVAP